MLFGVNVKKLLLIFLLIVLPVQYSWAVVAVYCQHEKKESTHLGHHQHEHEAQNQQTLTDDGSSTPHDDCTYCHQACQASLVPTLAVLPYSDRLLQSDRIQIFFTSYIPDGLERPNWRPLT